MHTLSYDTTTTPIIDDYYNSDYFFLVIRDFFRNYRCVSGYSIDLVITRGYYNIPEHRIPAPTMTEIKKFVSSGNAAKRLMPLKNEIVNIVSKTNLKFGLCIPFEKPYPLGAQTFDDQTGYGWEWRFGVLEREGTLYGQVTPFFVLGIHISSKYSIDIFKNFEL